MTLSFMALLVVPELKLSDRGLFDGRAFTDGGGMPRLMLNSRWVDFCRWQPIPACSTFCARTGA